jgi:hypothetical protein
VVEIHELTFHDSKYDALANKQKSKIKTQNGKNNTQKKLE